MKRLALILMVFFVSTGDVFAQEAVRAAPAFQKNAAPQFRMNNEGTALYIYGHDTVVKGSNVTVSGNRIHPMAVQG